MRSGVGGIARASVDAGGVVGAAAAAFAAPVIAAGAFDFPLNGWLQSATPPQDSMSPGELPMLLPRLAANPPPPLNKLLLLLLRLYGL
jgi:hypothetical protein